MKALYICDEKDEWGYIRDSFSNCFPNIQLHCAISGDDAIDLLSFEGPFAMIIIEVSLKNEDPSQLAGKILSITGQRPFIFIGMEAMIKQRIPDALYARSESSSALLRPIEEEDFIAAVNKALAWVKSEDFGSSIEEFEEEDLLPMKIRGFYLFDTIAYDVYLELTQTKYTKIISANKKYSHSTIHSYARKNIKVLYLKKNDYLKFLEEGIENLLKTFESRKKLQDSEVIENQIKAVLLIHQYVKTVGVSENVIKLCDEVILCSRDIILENKKYRNVLSLFPKGPFDVATQSIMTLYLSHFILQALGWASETSKKKLGLASLLYDSMLDNEDLASIQSLEDPQLKMFKESEQENYRIHPLKAAEIAQHFTGYPEADFVVAQHHEKPKGDGFPNKLSTNKLTAHSCAFILANNYILKLCTSTGGKKNLLNIFREIKEVYNQGNFKDPLNALQRTIL
ncbi:hypothetical protein [Halobacteriovorax sp. ZH4_bin.1]|uniref:hypothetical protein n=1 Tax=unclassified Halobacteriovorax TaxID=2639665 RepID=UPI00371933C2